MTTSITYDIDYDTRGDRPVIQTTYAVAQFYQELSIVCFRL